MPAHPDGTPFEVFTCPWCEETVTSEDVKCPSCGYLPPPVVVEQRAALLVEVRP